MSTIPRRDVLAGAAAFASFATVAFLPGTAAASTRRRPGATAAPSLDLGDRAVVGKVNARRALRDLHYLSNVIGARISGTPSEHRAAQFIAHEMRRLQYEVTLQPFAVDDKFMGSLKVGRDAWHTGSSPNGALNVTVAGPLVEGKQGGAADYPENVTGKLVLIDRGIAGGPDPDSSVRVALAVSRGARGVLLVGVQTAPPFKAGAFSPRFPTTYPVPILGLGQAHGEWLRARLARGSVDVEATTVHHAGLTSYNVFAERRPSIPHPDNKVVMVSAHYDSVPGSPGANDDGSGTVLTMELARVLRRLPVQQGLRFAWWGSEEYGLIGSRFYVNGLSNAETGRITGLFQNDMVATSHPPANTYWLLSVDGVHNATTAAVAAAAERLGYVDQTDGPVVRGSSDHVPFHERGVAAANFSWRGEGGPANLEPVYHTPEDTVAGNVSKERLQVSLELIGAATYDLARRR